MERPVGLLRTRVARRLLALFTVSAFVPVLAMGVVSLYAVNRQLEHQSRERLRQLAKNAGQSVIEKAQHTEVGLRFLANVWTTRGFVDDDLRRGTPEVHALLFTDAAGAIHTTFGAAFTPPTLRPEQEEAVGEGAMAVAVDPHTPEVVAATFAVRPDDPESPRLWALVRGDSLWNAAKTFASLPTIADFCLLGPDHSALFCTSPGSVFPAAFDSTSPSTPLGTFDWKTRDDRFIVGYWSFFPAGTISRVPWTVVVAEGSAGFRTALAGFSTSFLLVLLLGLCTVFLLANTQIRRTMDPLLALDAGTRRIASGDLSTKVEVDTPDEFGRLAGSFNAMADNLREHFTQLEAARAVDRAVLSAFDSREVVRTVLDQLPSLVASRSSAVLLMDRTGDGSAALHWLTDVPSLGGTTVQLSKDDLEWLTAHPHHGLAPDGVPPFTRAARIGLGPGRLVILPLLVKEKVRGALLLEARDGGELDEADLRRARRMADQAAVALDDVTLVKELEDMSWGALRAFARAIDAKSKWTAGHSERVTELSLALGRDMGLGDADMEILHRGGLLHDIGKIGVPASVLDLPRALTPEERAQVARHPEIGARILEPIRAFAPCIPIVLEHHEHWDGSGYPAGLSGEAIHPLARIAAVADAYDAMASPRPYRKAMPAGHALAIIQEGAGTQFDPEVAAHFLRRMADQGMALEEVR